MLGDGGLRWVLPFFVSGSGLYMPLSIDERSSMLPIQGVRYGAPWIVTCDDTDCNLSSGFFHGGDGGSAEI